MKIILTRLDFHKDPTFDPEGLLDEEMACPYIVQYKKHWWNRLKYIMDSQTYCPKLFYSKEDALKEAKMLVINS